MLEEAIQNGRRQILSPVNTEKMIEMIVINKEFIISIHIL